MALTATFQADFKSFTDACAKAQVSLKGIETGAGNVESKLTRMGDSLSGTKIIQQATLMAEAVERVGGVSSLTEKELAKVGATAIEASEKLRSLGQAVPAGIQKIADAAIEARKALDQTKESVEQLPPATKSAVDVFTQLKTAVGLIGLGRLIADAVEFGSHLEDLKARTGESTDELQRLGFAGKQVGIDLDTVAQGINKLQKNLAEGDAGAAGAIEKLGLSVQTLLDMKPGEMFETISRQIATVPDPAQRTAIAIELLGKSGAELLPLLTANVDELAKGAHIMSEDTIKNLDRVDDAWARLKTNVLADVGEMIAGFQSLQGATRVLAKGDPTLGFYVSLADGADKAQHSVDALADSTAKAKTPFDKLLAGITSLKPAYADLDEAQKKIDENLRKSLTAWQAYNAEIKHAGDVLSGRDLPGQVKKLNDELNAAGTLTAAGFERLGKETDDLIRAGAKLTPQLEEIHAAWQGTHNLNAIVSSDIKKLTENYVDLAPAIRAAGAEQEEFEKKSQHFIDLVGKNAPNLSGGAKIGTPPPLGFADNFAKSLTQGLGPAVLGALQGGGDITKTIAGFFGESFTKNLFTSTSGITKGITDFFGKTIGGAINSFLPGLGALLGPAVSKIGSAIKNIFTGGEGAKVNDVRDAFAAEFGGLEKIHAKLIAIGREDLFKNLAFGPAKLAAIQKAIEDVRKAFGDAAADEADAQQFLNATIEKYGFSLDELPAKFQAQKIVDQAQLIAKEFTALTAAGFDTGVVIDKMGDNIEQFYLDAKKTGVEVPEAIRKVLQEAATAGKLFDENGNKVEDLTDAGIVFGQTMTQNFDRVIAKLDELIRKITNDLGPALENIPSPTVDVRVRMPKVIDDSQVFDGAIPVQAFASGGVVRKPTLAIVGESGPEAIVPLRNLGANGQGFTVNVDLRGSFFRSRDDAEALAADIAPHLFNAAFRLGVRR